ncbi:MAG: CIA30 family protein [Fibrobacter sp.]|nr:CIA30 family protein [Fibrobacter sp.]
MKKVILGLALAAATSAMALSASKVGPVSTYGALKANGSKLSGTCPQYANSAVQVKGMSLFWSSAADSSTNFYTEKAVNRMVSEMGIEVIRFAMGVKSDFDKGRGYITGGEDLQKAYLKNVVSAAVDNDIYVIIDWHIESGEGYTSDAKKFFEYAAKEYGKYNNVIFEVWNEPKDGASAATVAAHANAIIPIIRQYSTNLVLVGSPEWSSHPEQCAGTIDDDNYACTLHFYAASHPVGDNDGSYNKRAEQAMAKNVPVFASEWGTVPASGNGDPNEGNSNAWNTWMNNKNISWANWSASAMNETSAAFKNLAFDNGLTFTTSGNIVKGYLAGAHSYKDCGLNNGGGAGGNGGFSTGVADGANTDIIDDLEDGDRYAYTGGWWSAFADSDDDTDGRGKTSISNGKFENDFGKEVYDVLMKTKSGDKNTSKYVAGIEGIKLSQGAYKYAPYVALGLNLKRDTSIIDLSQCNAISYKFKGAAHNFRVETSLVTNWNFHHVAKDGSDGWKEVELTWDQFSQDDWGDKDKHFNLKTGMNKVQRFAWEVKGALDVPDAMNQPKYDYLYVDDVRCDGVTIKAISGASSDTPVVGTSSSSVVVGGNSSSSVAGDKPVSSAAVITSSSSESVTTPVVSAPTAIEIIDDVEDMNEVLKTTGTWYAYNDSVPGGKSSISNFYDPTLGGYVVVFPGAGDPTNGTEGFVGLTSIKWNQAEYTEAPFVALGLNMMADTSMGYDLSKCAGISYRYKGAGHRFKIQDGSVEDFAYHEFKVDTSSVWTYVNMEWDDIVQPSWTQDPKDLNKAAIKKMSWEVVGYKGFDIQPELPYLFVDDVVCMGDKTSIKAARMANSGIKMSVQGMNLNVVVASAGMTRVQIFDMMGNLVKSVSENMTAGAHQIALDDMGRGNYLVRVQNGNAMKSTRIAIK